MLTPDRPRRGLRKPALAAAVIAALLSFPGQAVTATDPPIVDSDATLETTVEADTTVSALRDQLDDLLTQNSMLAVENSALADENTALVDRNETLEANATNLRHEIDSLALERDRLQASIIHFDDLYGPLEADRQLLFELRKTLPETRPEAEAQIERIRRLALRSNPTRLGQVVDRMSETAPAFLDWRFNEYGSTQEASQAYIETGANAFDSTMNDFRSAVLLSVANRLDGLLNVIDRVR